MAGYRFTNEWFAEEIRAVWDQIMAHVRPAKILEVGSYEGASACYLIEKMASQRPIELHCVDTWEGGVENRDGGEHEADMPGVEARFRSNVAIACERASHRVELVVHKGLSDAEMARLLAGGRRNYFDFIYVDGSHQAPDVLCDAVLAFRLLRVGGVIAFDDYLWSESLASGVDPIRCPKPAIDAFTNLYCRKLRIVPAPLRQLYIEKAAD